jgi:hypothetical protein
MEEIRNAYKALVGNLEGNRPFRRYVCKWDDNVKIG